LRSEVETIIFGEGVERVGGFIGICSGIFGWEGWSGGEIFETGVEILKGSKDLFSFLDDVF
jgi:hypothetical protein